MAVPKRKTSKSVRNQRRSHHALSPVGLVECPTCGDMKRPHHVCAACGSYGTKKIVSVKRQRS